MRRVHRLRNRGISMMVISAIMGVASLAMMIIPKLMNKGEDDGAAALQKASATPAAVGEYQYAGQKALSPYEQEQLQKNAAPKAAVGGQTQPGGSPTEIYQDYRYSYEQAVKIISSPTSTMEQKKAAHTTMREHYEALQKARQ